jgi:hypothetical protein
MKLGLLGFHGTDLQSRTKNIGIYRPESNTHIQSFNCNARSYTYYGKFPLSFGGQTETSITGMTFSDDGTKVYILGSSTYSIYQYSLSIPWDITSYSSSNPSSSRELSNYIRTQTGTQQSLTVPQGVCFTQNGQKMHVVDNYNNKIVQFSLSTPWQISSLSFPSSSPWPMIGTYDMGVGETYGSRDDYDLSFSADGQYLLILGRNTSVSQTRMYRYQLNSGATAGDIGTSSSISGQPNSSNSNYTYVDAMGVSNQDNLMRGISFNDSGSQVFMCGLTYAWVYNINLNPPYAPTTTTLDITNINYDGAFFGREGAPQAIFVNAKENNLDYYLVGQDETIYQYKLILK